MRNDSTRTATSKARTLSRRTARKVKHAQAVTMLFLDTVFGPDVSPFSPRTAR